MSGLCAYHMPACIKFRLKAPLIALVYLQSLHGGGGGGGLGELLSYTIIHNLTIKPPGGQI